MRKLNWFIIASLVIAAMLAIPEKASAVPVTAGLKLWHEAGVHNYQAYTVAAAPANQLSNVTNPATLGSTIAATLNLADDPLLNPSGIWGPMFANSNSGTRPTLSNIDGRDSWNFPGTGNISFLTINLASNGSNLGTSMNGDQQSWFFAYRPSTLDYASGKSGVIFGSTDSGNWGVGTGKTLEIRINPTTAGAANLVVNYDPDGSGAATFQTLSTPATAGEWAVISIVRDGATLSAYHNGDFFGSLTGLTGSAVLGRYRMGINSSESSENTRFLGDVNAFLAYNTALSNSNRAMVESYLGVPEPNTAFLLCVGMSGIIGIARRRKLV